MKQPDVLIVAFLLPALPLSLALAGFRGLFGVYQRLFMILPYMSAIVVGYILATRPSKDERRIIYVLVSLIVTLSIISFHYDRYTESYTLTAEENRGNSYLAAIASPETIVFTDFRMGAPLLYRGLYGITGIESGYRPTAQSLSLLDAVYGGDATSAVSSIDHATGCECWLLVTSEQQARIGVSDLGALFKRAEQSFQQRFIENNAVDVIYSSGEVTIFKRIPG